MRIFVCTLVILSLLFASVFIYELVLAQKEKAADASFYSLSDAILNEDEQLADKKLSSLEEMWDSARSLLMAFSEHSQLDLVEERLKNIRSAYIYKNWADMYKEANVFHMLLKNCFESSKPTLPNIL